MAHDPPLPIRRATSHQLALRRDSSNDRWVPRTNPEPPPTPFSDQPRAASEPLISSSGRVPALSFNVTRGWIMLARDRFTHGAPMRCPSCMAENAASRRFCAECGAPLPSPCPACGFENEPTAKFCGGCGKPVGEAAAPAPSIRSPPPRTDRAERRQLTVMFCDLVGSTPLSSKLEPEDLREVIAAYHRAVAEVVTRLDGLISRYMGDGVWFISATHKRMRIMPNGRYGLG